MDEKVIIREKRRTPRVKQEVPIKLSIKDQIEQFEGKTRDLSCVGAKIILDNTLPKQTEISIVLNLPAGPQELGGVAVRSERVEDMYEISLYFNNITMETRRKINDFVKEKWI